MLGEMRVRKQTLAQVWIKHGEFVFLQFSLAGSTLDYPYTTTKQWLLHLTTI